MHELPITEQVVAQIAERMGAQRIRRVVLEIGKLSGVVPRAVEFCFDVCAGGTTLEGARLEIVEVSGRGHCRACDGDLDVDDPIVLCPCGSANVAVEGGDQLRVRAVEVDG